MVIKMNFKIGDKVKLFNIQGNSYGLRFESIQSAALHPFLTIAKIDNSFPRIWFNEVPGYWNPKWFKKINAQLEFNFNE
jgi:hypothetical protein